MSKLHRKKKFTGIPETAPQTNQGQSEFPMGGPHSSVDEHEDAKSSFGPVRRIVTETNNFANAAQAKVKKSFSSLASTSIAIGFAAAAILIVFATEKIFHREEGGLT